MCPHATSSDVALSVESVDEPSSHDCPPHETLTLLGADVGNNEYYRCAACGSVVVRFGRVDYEEHREERDLVVDRSWLGMASVKHGDGDGGQERSGDSHAGLGDRLSRVRQRLLGR